MPGRCQRRTGNPGCGIDSPGPDEVEFNPYHLTQLTFADFTSLEFVPT